MTKNVEMKWDKTKGNRNMSIKPLSPSGNSWSPVWGSDRGSESLGADPYLPRGLIESFLRVFKHFALEILRGKVRVFKKKTLGVKIKKSPGGKFKKKPGSKFKKSLGGFSLGFL